MRSAVSVCGIPEGSEQEEEAIIATSRPGQ
jgi:hypothetical protein